MKTTGTNVFLSYRDACIYYQAYCNSYDEACELVREKVNNKEIKFMSWFAFRQTLKTNQRATVKEGRFHIIEE
jgi:hypothetical protein